jgi:hypothetical protein
VKRTRAEDIVEFLGFSGSRGQLNGLRKASQREGEKLLQWLDDSGLAFYFLQKVNNAGARDQVPDWMLSRLEENFRANQRRMEYLSNRFDFINRKLKDADVKYAVLKGFSLVPQFCPQAALRHQSDLDYLIDERSVPAAQQVMLDAGYRPKPGISNQELIFLMPDAAEPSRSADSHYAPEPHAVELHLDIWDSDEERLPMVKRLIFVERSVIHEWNGLEFPVLADEDAFPVQVLHTFRHLFTYWIRMSCFLEIAYFINARASDTTLWNRIEQRVGDSVVLREFVVIITEIVASLFAVPVPALARAWGQEIRPEIRVWIESYARDCVFCDLPIYDFSLFPRSKLVLFLLQQYEGFCTEKHTVRSQLILPSRLGRIAASVRNDPSLLLNTDWWKRQHLMRRSIFHALAGLRYSCEIPRWRWRTRAQLRATSPNGDLLESSVTPK